MNSTQPLPVAGTLAYLNGRLVPASEARIPIDDHGVLFGLGFYETFRTCGGHPHLWRYHQSRLEQACAMAGIRPPPGFLARNETKLAEASRAMLAAAGVADAVFRYTLTAGSLDESAGAAPQNSPATTLYGSPNEFMTMRPLPATAPREGVALHVLEVRRTPGEWRPRPKSVDCVNALQAAAELRRRGADPADEGLFLAAGEAWVMETARQNVAWIRDGRLCYPDPALGPVAGTCLAWILELGCPAEPRRAPVTELVAADAVIVMNAVRGITPVREIRDHDDRVLVGTLGSHSHPVVVSLQRQWQEALQATAQQRG